MRQAGLIFLLIAAFTLAPGAHASTSPVLAPSSSRLGFENGILERFPIAPEKDVLFPAGSAVAAAAGLLTDKASGSDPGFLAQRAIRESTEPRESPAAKRSSQPKNPGKALLFSAVVPGTGEIYDGSNRGFIFLGVEALAWYGYFSFHSSGQDKETEFERFADNHWDLERLKASLTDPDCPDPRPDSLDIVRIEDFRTENQQHYYEDVGKLDVYQCGWDAAENRDAYRGIRRESNRLLTNARRAKTIAFMNHVASAVDAFLLAKRYNQSLGLGINMKLEMVADVNNPRGKVTFTRRFY